MINVINITPEAWSKIHEKLNNSSCTGVRISIDKGGCSGSTYIFEVTNDEPGKYESFLENNNHRVLIDPKSEMLLFGSTLDWIVKDQFNQGFDLINSKEKSRCGCGESVSF